MTIKLYCDMCNKEIGRNYISERFKPWIYRNNTNFSAEVIITKNKITNQSELCLDCVKLLVNEGKEV